MGENATGTTKPRHADENTRPYRGLEYYTEDDARWFFGRTNERKVIIAHLRTSRLTLLYAASGVGKSSLLRAGVAASLREAARESVAQGESPEFVPVVFKEWKDDPLRKLIAAIEHEAGIWEAELAKARRPAKLATESESGERLPNDLASVINRRADRLNTTFLIVLDQFEELFGYPSHQDALADALAGAINSLDVRGNFLIALREDVYGRIGELFERRIPSVYRNYLHLDYLTLESGREAIEKPVERYNEPFPLDEQVTVEPDLTEAVLDAVGAGKLALGGEAGNGAGAGAEPDITNASAIEAPFLQLVMERVWDWEMEHDSNVLRAGTLETELGGAAEIVRNHLNRALRNISPEDLGTATDIFSDLVAPSGTKIALTATDLSNRHEQHSEGTVAEVLKKLDEQRIVRDAEAAPNGDRRYEIYHDRLAKPILEWVKNRREVRLSKEKRQAEEEADRQKKLAWRFKVAASVAGVALVVCAGILAFAIVQWQNAKEQRKQALNQTTNARALALGSNAQLALASRPDVATVFALAAYRFRPRMAAGSMIAALEGFRRTGSIGILHGHTDTVNTVAFSPDGETLASGSGDRTIRLWSTTTRRQIGRPFAKVPSGLTAVVFSPNGRLLASAGGFDPSVRLWDVRSHTQMGEPIAADATGKPRYRYAYSVAFSPDGRRIVTAGHNHTIAMWDVATRREVGPPFVCRPPCEPVTSVAFANDGRRIVSAGYDGDVRIWDAATHRQLARIPGGVGTIYAIAVNRNSSQLAYAGTDGTIRVLNLTGASLPSPPLAGHRAAITGLAFNGNDELASASADATVRLWNTRTRRPTGQPLTGHGGTVLGVTFSPDGRTLASAGTDGTIRLWGARRQDRFGEPLPGRGGAAYAVAVGRDGSGVASAGSDGKVRLWLLPTRTRLGRPLKGPGGPIRSIAFSPDGAVLAAGSRSGGVRMWNVPSGTTVATLARGRVPVLSVNFSPDGHVLVAADKRGDVTFWDVQSRHVTRHFSTGQATLHSAIFSPDGRTLATAGGTTIMLWNPASGQRTGLLLGSSAPINALAFSPDGRTLLSGGDDKTLRLWNVRTGTQIGTLTGSTGQILGVAFSPDGHTLASGGSDNALRLWDVGTQSELGPPLTDHEDSVFGVAFTPDGRTLVSAGGDATVRVWSGVFWRSLPDLKSQVCALIGTGFNRSEWSRYAHGIPFQPTCP